MISALTRPSRKKRQYGVRATSESSSSSQKWEVGKWTWNSQNKFYVIWNEIVEIFVVTVIQEYLYGVWKWLKAKDICSLRSITGEESWACEFNPETNF